MQFYETPTPNDEEKPSEPIPAETEAQVPKGRAAAKKAISGGFCLTVVPNACMRAYFACGVFPARLSAGKLIRRAACHIRCGAESLCFDFAG